jgi:hypothetical protein
MGVTDSIHVKSRPLRPRDNPREADVVIKPEEDEAQQLDNGFARYLGIDFRLIFVGLRFSRYSCLLKGDWAEFVVSARPRVIGDYVTCLVGNCENFALEQLQDLGGIRGRIPCC